MKGFRRGRAGARVLLGALLILLVVLPGIALTVYHCVDWPVWALEKAGTASPAWSQRWYGLIAQRYPALKPYAALWAAERSLPEIEAVQTLHTLSVYLPDGPVGFQAHVALARYYAEIESPKTVSHYQAALDIDERPDVRLEMAWYLEEQRALSSAYQQYLRLLGSSREDAFVGARRTAPDRLTLAADLLDRGYLSDVLDVLYGIDDFQAYCLRGTALQRMGRAEDARATFAICEAGKTPTGSDDQPTTAYAGDAFSEPARTPLDLWNETWALEEEMDYAAALPLYLELSETESAYADDSAYRALVLARRLDDESLAERARSLLAAMQPSWLAYLEFGKLELCLLAEYPAQDVDELTAPVLARVTALEELNLTELAHQELRLTALTSETPEVIQRMAQELLQRGYITEAWSLGSAQLERNACASPGIWRLAYPRPYRDLVQAAAEAQQLDAALLWSVMRQESAYQAGVVSRAGARGLMQIMPFTHQAYCEAGAVACAPGALFEPRSSIEMGAAHLRRYIDYYDGEVELGILAYNAGPGNVDQWLADPAVQDRDDLWRLAWFGETREYLERVMLDMLVYRQLYFDE